MTFLHVNKVSKRYSDLKILNNISFSIKKGEFVSIIGPNGCGKTTLLHILSFLDTTYKGKITYHEKNLKIGFIFQNPDSSLLPWKTITENITLGKKNIDNKKIEDILKKTNLWKFRSRYPYQLSGGMKQLLAISRAFIHECNLLLLDEPFSSLDHYASLKTRSMLENLWEKKRPTVIFVSHDIDDAIILSDRIIVLTKRPAKIKKIIKISISRPRSEFHAMSQEFLRHKKIILKSIKDEISK